MRPRPTTAPRAAALALGCLLVLAGCGEGVDDATATGATGSDPGSERSGEAVTPTPSPAPSSSTPSPGSADPTTSPGSTAGGSTVAVYLAGQTPQGLRLYREFRAVPAGDALVAAVGLLSGGDVLDPDYRSLFPGGSFASVVHDEDAGRIVAELRDDGWVERPADMTGSDARLAVQQLVHTAQAAVQERVPVVVTLDGTPTSLFGLDTADGVRNDDPLDVLALVSVTAPEQGGTVRGSFRASGVASAFEANVPWQLRRGDEVVLEGFATAEGWMDRLYPWQTEEIDVSGLEPGAYTFVASTGDASSGEGPGPTTDSKEIEVR